MGSKEDAAGEVFDAYITDLAAVWIRVCLALGLVILGAAGGADGEVVVCVVECCHAVQYNNLVRRKERGRERMDVGY